MLHESKCRDRLPLDYTHTHLRTSAYLLKCSPSLVSSSSSLHITLVLSKRLCQPKAVMASQSAPIVEIPLPQEQQTPLPEPERSQILDPHSGETLSEERTKDAETGSHILVALDPEAQQGQFNVAIEAAKRAIKSGDTVILFSVMIPVA